MTLMKRNDLNCNVIVKKKFLNKTIRRLLHQSKYRNYIKLGTISFSFLIFNIFGQTVNADLTVTNIRKTQFATVKSSLTAANEELEARFP